MKYKYHLIWRWLAGASLIWCSLSQATTQSVLEHLVAEPIFKGKALIYEYGDSANKSIVLVHGLGRTPSQDWQKLIPVLASDYHVIAFDLPGFGRSSKSNKNYSPENYANFVNWVVNQYVDGDFILVGHSMGGAIALYFAAYYPRQLELLILVDAAGILHRLTFSKHVIKHYKPASWWPDFDLNKINGMLGFRLEDLERFPVAFELIVATPFTRNMLLSADPLKIAGLSMIITNFSDIIERVSTPTQIIWGKKDPIAPMRTGILLSHRLSNAKLNVIENAGHNPMLQTPQEFNQLLLQIAREGSFPKSKQPKTKTDSSWFSFTKDAERVVECRDQNNKVFTGAYKSITLNNCEDIQLKSVHIEYLEVVKSTVNIVSSTISSENVALMALNSTISATAVDIKGETGMVISNSKLDLAGVSIVATKQAIQAKINSSILFSVSHINSPKFTGALHQVVEVDVTTSNRF